MTKIKSVLFFTLLVFTLWLHAEPEQGLLHLIYDNGVVTYDDTATYLEFDVKMWISEYDLETDSTEILGELQFYIVYPSSICGSFVVENNNVWITKTGILEGSSGFQSYYTTIGTGMADTRSNVMSVAYEATTQDPGNKTYYYDRFLSSSESNPSNLFHIKIQALNSGTDSVKFDPDINDPDILFWDFERNLFGSGLDYSEAWEIFEVDVAGSGDPGLPIELTEFSAVCEQGAVRLDWETETETENLGFFICRSQNGGKKDTLASYLNSSDLLGQGTTQETHFYSYTDAGVHPGTEYTYTLLDVDYAGSATEHTSVTVTTPSNSVLLSDNYEFGASYPNPFNPRFTIPFTLKTNQRIMIDLFDLSGRKVMTIADGSFRPGTYNLTVDGSSLGSGVYLLRTRVDNKVNTQKMILLK